MTTEQTPDVESCIVALVKALQESKGWLHGYADAVIRDAIDRRVDASLLSKEAECEALRSALSGVKNAGAPLANFAFNLAQHPGRSLNQRECDLIDLCRKDWDAAIDAALVAAKGAK